MIFFDSLGFPQKTGVYLLLVKRSGLLELKCISLKQLSTEIFFKKTVKLLTVNTSF